jgi:hypothetical protein
MMDAVLSGSEPSPKVDLDLLSNFSNFDFEIAHEDQGKNDSRKVMHSNLAALDKLKRQGLTGKKTR